jgi:hypothetical protein
MDAVHAFPHFFEEPLDIIQSANLVSPLGREEKPTYGLEIESPSVLQFELAIKLP